MEETAKKALDLLEQSATFAKGFIEKHGPQAWDSVLWVYRIEAARLAIMSVVALIFTRLYYNYWHKNFLTAYRGYAKENPHDELFDNGAATTAGMAIFWVVPVFLITRQFSDLWMWVSLFKPELKVAYDMFNKVTK